MNINLNFAVTAARTAEQFTVGLKDSYATSLYETACCVLQHASSLQGIASIQRETEVASLAAIFASRAAGFAREAERILEVTDAVDTVKGAAKVAGAAAALAFAALKLWEQAEQAAADGESDADYSTVAAFGRAIRTDTENANTISYNLGLAARDA